MRKFIGLVAVLSIASSALAADFIASPTFGDSLKPDGSIGAVVPGTESYSAVVTAFSFAGGAYATDKNPTDPNNLDIYTFDGAVESMGFNYNADEVLITESQTELGNGNLQIVVEMYTATGVSFLPAGTSLGGAIVDTYGFEVGGGNASADPIDTGFSGTPTVVSLVADLYAGTTLLASGGAPSYATVTGTDVAFQIFWSDTGQDLGAYGINRHVFTLEIAPEPASLFLLGLAGLFIRRR